MNEASQSTQGNDSRPAIRSLTVDTPDTLLSERGDILRELGRRLMTPLAELLRKERRDEDVN